MDSKNIGRIAFGVMLIGAGIAHLTLTKEVKALVPNWVPFNKKDTVIYSGYGEIALGAATIAAPEKYHSALGNVLAAFLVAVFPGNYSQYKNRRDSIGLDTDGKRLARLFLQPLMMGWALWSTKK